jgi:hypothetical protein
VASLLQIKKEYAMTREELDTLWFKAMHESIKDGEDFIRYRFAALVAAAEREACALVAESYEPTCESCPSGVANAIRARRDK